MPHGHTHAHAPRNEPWLDTLWTQMSDDHDRVVRGLQLLGSRGSVLGTRIRIGLRIDSIGVIAIARLRQKDATVSDQCRSFLDIQDDHSRSVTWRLQQIARARTVVAQVPAGSP